MLKLTPEISEIVGMYVGYGYLRYFGTRKEWDISGSYEEQVYYDKYVIPLVNETFNLNITGKFFPSRGTYGFRTSNAQIINLLKELGFPSGNKSTTIFIPKIILKSIDKEMIYSFLRGYFDTDGSFTFDKKMRNTAYFQKKYHYYPRIMFSTCSKRLNDELLILFSRLKFNCKSYSYKPTKPTESLKYKLQITGKEAIDKWMELIGSNNHTKLSRYLIWKKWDFCPPKTTYQQRLDIIKGKLDPHLLYGPMV